MTFVISAMAVAVPAMMAVMTARAVLAMVAAVMMVIVMSMMAVVDQGAEGDRRRQRRNVVMAVVRARGHARGSQPEQACNRDDSNLFNPCFEHDILRFSLKSGEI